MTVQLADSLPLMNARLASDGSLLAEVRAARSGLYTYRGAEIGRPDLDAVRVYRPETETFSKPTLDSLSSLTVTHDHPPEGVVTPRNWKRVAVGWTGEDVIRDGGFVRVPLILKDEDTIDAVRAGKRELSFGYLCDFDFTPGKTKGGEAYDAVQKDLRGNHLAIVERGRAGRECAFDKDGEAPMATRMITVDGPGGSKLPVEVTDAAATVIDGLQRHTATLTTDNIRLIADHKTAMDAKDLEVSKLKEQLGAKDAELTETKKKIPDAAATDALVAERVDVIGKATSLVGDFDPTGKSNDDIRKFVVEKNGEKLAADASARLRPRRFQFHGARRLRQRQARGPDQSDRARRIPRVGRRPAGRLRRSQQDEGRPVRRLQAAGLLDLASAALTRPARATP